MSFPNKKSTVKSNKTKKNSSSFRSTAPFYSSLKTERNVCDSNLTFNECELAILRSQSDKAKERQEKRKVNSPEIKKMISIVEQFIRYKKSIVYGGTALNNILPENDQFYNKELEIPDYDFYSPTALDDAKELADIFFENGFEDCEAKSGMHHGTYKVYVNFIPIADITYLSPEIYNALRKEAIDKNGILYTPVNFLRMSVYLELSRPAGDVERWNKVYDRLLLLNKHYPFNSKNCSTVEFQRGLEKDSTKGSYKEKKENEMSEKIYEITRDTFIKEGCVFFGGYAISQYSQYMPPKLRKRVQKYADFDVISYEAKSTAEKVKEALRSSGIEDVKVIKREPVGEIIPLHYEIKVGIDTIAFVYKPIACHSYNMIETTTETGSVEKVKIATIDTMLTFYLAFLYTNRPYYNAFLDRTICMAAYLFEVQQQNRLEQKGLLKRFSINCYGHQETVEEIKAEKARKYAELKNKKGTREYEEWFLSYQPYKKFMNVTETMTTPLNSKEQGQKEQKQFEEKEEKSFRTKTTPTQTLAQQLGKRRNRRTKGKKRNINPYTRKKFNMKLFMNRIKSRKQRK